MRMVEKVERAICRVFGHKKCVGELKRSPYTVYTHWRDITCSRCGAYIGHRPEYHDARTEQELFQPDKARERANILYGYSDRHGK